MRIVEKRPRRSSKEKYAFSLIYSRADGSDSTNHNTAKDIPAKDIPATSKQTICVDSLLFTVQNILCFPLILFHNEFMLNVFIFSYFYENLVLALIGRTATSQLVYEFSLFEYWREFLLFVKRD